MLLDGRRLKISCTTAATAVAAMHSISAVDNPARGIPNSTAMLGRASYFEGPGAGSNYDARYWGSSHGTAVASKKLPNHLARPTTLQGDAAFNAANQLTGQFGNAPTPPAGPENTSLQLDEYGQLTRGRLSWEGRQDWGGNDQASSQTEFGYSITGPGGRPATGRDVDPGMEATRKARNIHQLQANGYHPPLRPPPLRPLLCAAAPGKLRRAQTALLPQVPVQPGHLRPPAAVPRSPTLVDGGCGARQGHGIQRAAVGQPRRGGAGPGLLDHCGAAGCVPRTPVELNPGRVRPPWRAQGAPLTATALPFTLATAEGRHRKITVPAAQMPLGTEQPLPGDFDTQAIQHMASSTMPLNTSGRSRRRSSRRKSQRSPSPTRSSVRSVQSGNRSRQSTQYDEMPAADRSLVERLGYYSSGRRLSPTRLSSTMRIAGASLDRERGPQFAVAHLHRASLVPDLLDAKRTEKHWRASLRSQSGLHGQAPSFYAGAHPVVRQQGRRMSPKAPLNRG